MQSNQRCRILAVDDTAANLFLLKTALEEEGYDVDTANNGSLALAKIEASPPSIVLLDVIMPGISGVEVTRRIRENPLSANIAILIVSGSDEACVAEALDAGANDSIRKPVKIDELLTKINKLCY
ncbi:response regulator receiver signal transduction histidine kinase [Tolypothrix sp. NIES-4075]|uniref:response regulator n=1 Tax=Tolypothrix sp. NIES-4075 TaxID=2005459 RepID=UPI000B5C91A4|nr:response regulator [Tolypothrix sp. NIES-4075]GAX42473.1 response regulator receiver signal transduction histidine kinase [Tolypothrix sp. NIES-4075]